MIERRFTDDDMRSLFARNSPIVDERRMWEGVRREVATRARARRRRLVPVVTVAVAVLVVLAGVAVWYGALELLQVWRAPHPVVLIGEPSQPSDTVTTTTLSGSATQTSAGASTETTAGVTDSVIVATPPGSLVPKGEFIEYIKAWSSGNMWLADVQPHPELANGIVLTVLQATLELPEGLFNRHQIMRQAFLVTHKHDYPYDWLDVYSRDRWGKETFAFGMNPREGMAFAQGWSSGEILSLKEAGAMVRSRVLDVATTSGAWATAEFLEDSDGRTLSMKVTLPSVDEREVYRAFLGSVFGAVLELNRRGCHIAEFELSIDDAEGGPILRDVHDYQLGSVSSWYTSPDFMPAWIDPPLGMEDTGEGGAGTR